MDTKSQEFFYQNGNFFFHSAAICANLRWIRRSSHACRKVRLPPFVLRIADSSLHNERQAAKQVLDLILSGTVANLQNFIERNNKQFFEWLAKK